MYIMDRETNIVSKETCGMKRVRAKTNAPDQKKEYAKSLSLHIWENHLNAKTIFKYVNEKENHETETKSDDNEVYANSNKIKAPG